MKRTALLFLVLFSLVGSAFGQLRDTIYREAFGELKSMLAGETAMSFKRAVFITENAYLENQMSFDDFDQQVHLLAALCRNIAFQNPIIYNETDKAEVNKYAAVFRLMTDSVKFTLDTTNYFVSEPYRYDFDDFWGEKRWEKMFVTKLLRTHAGNCHSLPFLYKILCEELGGHAYLAMAPNHIYIKQWSKKTGWYNTELTSRYFPIDAWIMASGYVHLSSVQNRLYMDTLSQQQSIAVCLTDLAKGFQRKFPDDIEFVDECVSTALKYYPNYINALLLKAEISKRRFERLMSKAGAKYPSDLFHDPESKELFQFMEARYMEIHSLGYRMMPREMYISWLSDLRHEKDKYLNKTVISTFTQPEGK